MQNQDNQGSGFPPDIPTVSASDFFPPTPPAPTKKVFKGKMVSAIFGMVLLVGGLAAGVALVRQPQLLNQKAATISYASCPANLYCSGNDIPGSEKCLSGTQYGYCCPLGSTIVNGACGPITDTSCSSGMTRCQIGFNGTQTGSVQVCTGQKWYTTGCGGGTCSNGACVYPQDSSTGCFLAGTQVSTVNGTKSIEALSVNDSVLSFNQSNVENSRVSNIYKVTRDHYYHILAGGNEVDVTAEHPFYVGNGKYVEAQDLKVGDTVYLLNRGSLVASKLSVHQRIDKRVEAYNLSVDTNHTFFANGFAVHNKLPMDVAASDPQTQCSKYHPGSVARYIISKPNACLSDEAMVGIAYKFDWYAPDWSSCCAQPSVWNAAQTKTCGNLMTTISYTGSLGTSGTKPVNLGLSCRQGAAKDCLRSSNNYGTYNLASYLTGVLKTGETLTTANISSDAVGCEWAGGVANGGYVKYDANCCP